MSHVTFQVSHVMCHMSHVTCQVSHVTFCCSSFLRTNWWSFSVEGMLSTGPTPSSLISIAPYMLIIFSVYNVHSTAIFAFWQVKSRNCNVCIIVCVCLLSKLFLCLWSVMHFFLYHYAYLIIKHLSFMCVLSLIWYIIFKHIKNHHTSGHGLSEGSRVHLNSA